MQSIIIITVHPIVNKDAKKDDKNPGCNLSLTKIIFSQYLSQINFLTAKSQGKSISQN